MGWIKNIARRLAPPGYVSRDLASCSFCLQGYEKLRPLVEGPKGVFICDACIDRRRTTMDEEKRRLGMIPPAQSETLAPIPDETPASS